MKKLIGQILYSDFWKHRENELSGDPGLTRTGDLLLRRPFQGLFAISLKLAFFQNIRRNLTT